MRNLIYAINLSVDGCCDHAILGPEGITDEVDKVAFSRSLAHAEANTRIVRSNLGDEILALKKEKGKNISVGGVDVAEQLMALGLVDEFYFFILPVMVGEGRRLLQGTSLRERLNLKLAGSKTFRSGGVALHYSKLS